MRASTPEFTILSTSTQLVGRITKCFVVTSSSFADSSPAPSSTSLPGNVPLTSGMDLLMSRPTHSMNISIAWSQETLTGLRLDSLSLPTSVVSSKPPVHLFLMIPFLPRTTVSSVTLDLSFPVATLPHPIRQ